MGNLCELFFLLQEVFVQDLALMSLKLGDDPKMVEYNTLANIVNDDETMQFLLDIRYPRFKKISIGGENWTMLSADHRVQFSHSIFLS